MGFGGEGSEGAEEVEGADSDLGADAASSFGAGEEDSAGTSMEAMSSPSSASRAMSLPTATPEVPSLTYNEGRRSCVLARAPQPSELGACCFERVLQQNKDSEILTIIFPSTPSSCASTSIEALSVSMDTKTSPALKLSPTLYFHSVTVPSVMVGDMAGMSNSEVAAVGREAWTVGWGGEGDANRSLDCGSCSSLGDERGSR